MKKFVIPTITLGLCLAFAPTSDASTVKQYKQGNVWVRTVIHDDGCLTISKRDNQIKEVVKETFKPMYNAEGIMTSQLLLSKSKFEINEKGDYIRGQVFDRTGNLSFISSFVYDQFDRILEERVTDARGVPVRRLIYRYDQFGKARPFAISFENGEAKGGPTAIKNAEDYSTGNDRGFRVDPNAEQQQARPQTEEKERFRLFKKKDSDSSSGERKGLFNRKKK